MTNLGDLSFSSAYRLPRTPMACFSPSDSTPWIFFSMQAWLTDIHRPLQLTSRSNSRPLMVLCLMMLLPIGVMLVHYSILPSLDRIFPMPSNRSVSSCLSLVRHTCNSTNESGNVLATLLPPAKRKQVGRPTTSREKAPYEGLSKRTGFCVICRQQGHKRTTCPERGDIPKQPRKPARCKNCGVEGHRRNNCHKAAELRLR